MKPYSEGDYVKKCLTDIAEEMCPKMVQEFEKISLSRWTIARHIDKLAGDICHTLKDKVKNFVSWSFAIDKSTDVKDAAQLAIFIKVMDKELNEADELLSLQCMRDTTAGANTFLKFSMLLISLGWTYPLYAESQLMVLDPCPNWRWICRSLEICFEREKHQ